MSKLFISCIDPRSILPSGKLANMLDQYESVLVVKLFEDSRRFIAIFSDVIKLTRILKSNRYSEIVINVNGSHIRLLLACLAIIFRARLTVIIMDVYPQCLRYVTRYWQFFYVIFGLFEFCALAIANKIIIIDEQFRAYFPIKEFNSKTLFAPIDFLFDIHKTDSEKFGVLLCGNIEEKFLKNNNLQFLCNFLGQPLVVATSKFSKLVINQAFPDAKIHVPWPADQTDDVMNQCKYMYIPLSSARVAFSSPSKILDCYSRSIIPIIDCDIDVWRNQKHRRIYCGAIHISEVGAAQENKNILATDDRSLLRLVIEK